MFAEAAIRRRFLVPSTGCREWGILKEKGKSGKILKEPINTPVA